MLSTSLSTVIYAVRHGETDWNAESRIQGQTDTFLTSKGIEQAKKLNEQLKDIKFDAVYCSPLSRAKDTCKIILGSESQRVFYEPALMERDFGEVVGKIDDYMSFWNLQKPRSASGLETIEQMKQRIYPLLERILKDCKGKTILLVSHRGANLIIENFFGNAPKDGDYSHLELQNCGYRIFNAK